MEEYNSLKGRNEFLKAQVRHIWNVSCFVLGNIFYITILLHLQLAEIKKAEAGEMEEEPKISEAEKSCSATKSTPIFSHNKPSIVPCFWPPIIPSSDVFQFLCAAHSHNMSSQFPTPQGDIPCSHQGQENSMGNARPGTPLFVLPVPWLLPFLTQHSTLHSNTGTNDRTNARQCSKCSCSETRPHEDNNQLSSNQNTKAEATNSMKTMSMDSVHRAGLTLPPESGGQYTARHFTSDVIVPGLFSPVRPLETRGPPRSFQVDDTAGVNVVSTTKSMRHGLSQRNQEPIIVPRKKPEDVFAASVARRRRKELMKLKNADCHNVQTRY